MRIEDTDVKREVKGGIEVIKDGLTWLGLTWDEFYRQSERLPLYRKYAKELLEKGKAYEEDGGIILKAPKKEIAWRDLVRGEISFPAPEMKDFAILKKDGYPTYNFAVVVDDWETKISHVIRAEDHISNTPRQIMVYHALGVAIPQFAHIPLLRNRDKSKISKRKNPVALSWFREEGYLPEALINFFGLLGWSHPEEKEIFDLPEFIEKFDIGRVRKAGPVFDMEKLDWINGEYIRKIQDSRFKNEVIGLFGKKFDEKIVEKTIPLVRERIHKFSEYKDMAGFFFEKPKVDKKLFGKNYKNHLKMAITELEKMKEWKASEIGEKLVSKVKKEGVNTSEFFMDLRIAVTGKKVTPPLNESMQILGKKETLKRIQIENRER